ncbi:sugar nucleotide-binding protein [Proteobacteria bacterium 005FR1]|nr:sugar nucleotide-binding protein [Proteobacteria bacterium 005FR1]
MVLLASKRVLAIGPEQGLVATVAQELDAGNMPVSFVADHSIDWNDLNSVEALFDQHKPNLLLHEADLRTPSLLEAASASARAGQVERAYHLASACEKFGCVAMHLSDYHVFGGDTKNAYDEADPIAPLDSYGAMVAEIEQQFAGVLDKHLVLRFSWLIDPEGDNLFTRIVNALNSGLELPLSSYRRGAPTWQADARRVVSGVLRQVMAGAGNWGYFHYCSADGCNELEFGQEVQATFEELRAPSGRIVARAAREEGGYPLEPASATLNSRRICNNFGVHGRSWRQGLKAQISHWLDRQDERGEVRSTAS